MLFHYRSYQKELLDRTDIPFEDIKRNMEELDTINRYLGGHKITLAGVKKIIGKSSNILIIEIGCGGGDNLRQVEVWCRRKNIKVKLVGIDINAECIAFAKSLPSNKKIDFICSDYKMVQFEKKPDLIFSSLFCHHFTDDDLVYMLQWMQQNSELGFFINDLHRHALAYHSIKLLTQAFSKSYLVKNDAPLSVQRGFSKKDWQNLFERARIDRYDIEWRWAFRWLISYIHQQ